MNFKLWSLATITGVLSTFCASSQDFSNKGKDFWVGYGLHCRMFQNNSGGTQDMVLYFATEAVTNVKVEIPALGYVQNYNNIPANTIFTSNPLPKNGSQDSRLIQEGKSNKGIHITSDKPIVAYAHIYNGNVSGATLLFPTNTLGKEYYSINFDEYSNETNSNCFFYAIATDTGTTKIEVVPSANTQTMIAGNTYTFDLTQGQVFNALGQTFGSDGVDLTGSKIRSISTSTSGCKRIAVFSGSGKINIKCPIGPSANSADNYMVQAFPKNAWGKYYLTVPTSQMPNNYFRIAVTDPTTVVKVNGVTQTNLINNFYYQVNQSNTPNLIEADKPVMVAQYITSANQCGNTALGGDGDPEVIYLSPVEQNIDKVIINSTANSAITRHYINVVIPNGGTSLSSFRIDGAPPSAPFVVHPRNSSYSYLVQSLSPGQHTIQSDSSFNAIAYGYGAAESYGYNAGANVKDLYQFVSVQNQYATVNFPAACKSSPFYFSITFPYQPTEIKWVFGGLFTDITNSSPVYDSTWNINGKQLYKYKLANPYTISTIGTYPIKIIAKNPTPEGCSGEQEINYDLQVFERPVADFNFTASGCISDSVHFFDNANTNGRSAIKWSWNFGDGGTGIIKNPVHLYQAAGAFPVKYSVITDIGCLSDTVTKTVTLNDPPVAKFGITSPYCAGKSITVSDSSATVTGTIVKWYWNFGDGSPQVIATSNTPQVHTFSNTGTYTITLKVETSTGCQSLVVPKTITVHPNPVASFNFGNACLPGGIMQFTNTSTISDGTGSQFSYQWTFSDGGSSTAASPQHTYSSTGPFSTKLVVTSVNGCMDSISQQVATIYNQPVALFSAPAEVCFGTTVNFSDQSSAQGNSVSQWFWNFGDGQSSNLQNPTHDFTTPGIFDVTLLITSTAGCSSQVFTKQIRINALPSSSFSISSPLCVTRDITFSDASVSSSGSIIKWTWDFGDGSTIVRNDNLPFTHLFSQTGTFPVSLITQTDRGCLSQAALQQVTINPLPVPGFILPDNCLLDPYSQFTDTSKIADGSQSQFTYLWNFGDPNANALNPNTSVQNNPRHKYTVVGPYNVTLTVTSGKGCASSLTQQFVLNSTQPQSVFSFATPNPQCSNQTVSIINGSTIDVGRITRMEIFWDNANDPSIKSVITLPTAGSIYSHSYPEFFTPLTKDYVIRVVVYSGDSCSNTSFSTITVKATPQILTSPIPGICADAPAFQITRNLANNLPGTGVFSGTGISSTGVFNPQTAGAGTHNIRYTFTGTNGCVNFTDESITVFPVPSVNAGPDKFILEGGNAVLTATATGSGLSYIWNPSLYLNQNNILQPVTTPADDITYTLKVISADGCSATDETLIKVLKTPTIPNTFSPNGDGIHDRWEIKYLESYPGATVEIYNRYGQLIFQSTGYSKPWDGTFRGSPLPAGTYYYIINPKNGRKQMAGFVDIIR